MYNVRTFITDKKIDGRIEWCSVHTFITDKKADGRMEWCSIHTFTTEYKQIGEWSGAVYTLLQLKTNR